MAKEDTTLVAEFERLQKATTEAIVAEAKRIKRAVGDRPLWGKRRTPVERLQYYDQIKNDPDEWDKIIQKQGPGEALKFAVEMERLRQKRVSEQEPLI